MLFLLLNQQRQSTEGSQACHLFNAFLLILFLPHCAVPLQNKSLALVHTLVPSCVYFCHVVCISVMCVFLPCCVCISAMLYVYICHVVCICRVGLSGADKKQAGISHL